MGFACSLVFCDGPPGYHVYKLLRAIIKIMEDTDS
jgi:hypothetical protein